MFISLCTIVLLLAISIANSGIVNLSIQDPNRFGPYNLNYTRLDLCMGPKSKNLTKTEISLTSSGNALLNFTYLESTVLDEVRMAVYSVEKGKITHLLYTYKLKDPCKHFALNTMIRTFTKTSSCYINKGLSAYNHIINLKESSLVFFGKSFFYGEYLIKLLALSKKGNIVCVYMGMLFTKKSVSELKMTNK